MISWCSWDFKSEWLLPREEDILPSWYPGKDIIYRNAQLKSLKTEDGTSDYLISFPDLVNYAYQRFFIIFNFKLIICNRSFFAENANFRKVLIDFGSNFWNEFFRNLNFDVHFASQMSQCHPCAINYDYIIKLETIYEDIQARFFIGRVLIILIGLETNQSEHSLKTTKVFNGNPESSWQYKRVDFSRNNFEK